MYLIILLAVLMVGVFITLKYIFKCQTDSLIGITMISCLLSAMFLLVVNLNYKEREVTTELISTDPLIPFSVNDKDLIFLGNTEQIQIFANEFKTLPVEWVEIYYIEDGESSYLETYKTSSIHKPNKWFLKFYHGYTLTTYKLYIPKSSVNSDSLKFKEKE